MPGGMAFEQGVSYTARWTDGSLVAAASSKPVKGKVKELLGMLHFTVDLDIMGILQEPPHGKKNARRTFGDTPLWKGLSMTHASLDSSMEENR